MRDYKDYAFREKVLPILKVGKSVLIDSINGLASHDLFKYVFAQLKTSKNTVFYWGEQAEIRGSLDLIPNGVPSKQYGRL